MVAHKSPATTHAMPQNLLSILRSLVSNRAAKHPEIKTDYSSPMGGRVSQGILVNTQHDNRGLLQRSVVYQAADAAKKKQNWTAHGVQQKTTAPRDRPRQPLLPCPPPRPERAAVSSPGGRPRRASGGRPRPRCAYPSPPPPRGRRTARCTADDQHQRPPPPAAARLGERARRGPRRSKVGHQPQQQLR